MPTADFFHLLNPNSKNRPRVAALFANQPRGSYAWVEKTSHPTHLETLVEWAVREGHPKIAVWGGDGTFSRVIQALYELDAISKVAIALSPAGTCNDFARRAKSPGSIDIGLIEADGKRRVFINNAGFGRSGEARRRKPNPIKDILEFNSKNVAIDGKKQPVFLGMICNAPYFSGGLHFATDVDPADGVLNSFFVSPQNKAKLLLKFIGARLGRPLQDGEVTRLNSKRIDLKFDHPVFLQADGEWLFKKPVANILFSMLEKKLNFYGTDIRR